MNINQSRWHHVAGNGLLVITIAAGVALGQAGAAGAQPTDPSKDFDRAAYDTCTENKLNSLYNVKGASNLTTDDLNGVIIDCCLVAGGNSTVSNGFASCDEVSENQNPPVKNLPTKQQGQPPVLQTSSTPTSPVPSRTPRAPVPAQSR